MAYLIASFFIAIASSSVYAATIAGVAADAGAFIDYESISITFTGEGLTKNTYYETGASVTGQSAVTDSLDAFLSTDYSYAWGEADGSDSDISATANVTDPYTNESARAYSGFFGEFEAGTTGTLTISINYYFTANAQAGQGLAALAAASVLLDIDGEELVDSLAYNAANGSGYEGDTEWLSLSLSYDLAAGQAVDFKILASADAQKADPVPVPGTFMLLGSGLIGILGIRKKTKK